MIPVIKFNNEETVQKFCDFIHLKLKGDMPSFYELYPDSAIVENTPALKFYNAIKWADTEDFKHSISGEWAVNLNSSAIVKYRSMYPEVDDQVKQIFGTGIQIEFVEKDYWD